MKWDREKIKSILPQREPFLFLDEIVEIDGTHKVVALKHIRKDEDFFVGHFPGSPVMPGVLTIEAMAQASIVLFSIVKPNIVKTNPDYYIGKVKAEFISPVLPGDELFIEAFNVKILDYAAITDTEAKVNDKVVARANIVFSIQKNE